MRSPMNKENRHTTRTVVAKRGSVVLAPVPTAREPRRPRSQQTDAVLQLVTAVKDHLRFRQLATYAVDTFSKSLAPQIAVWRAYVEAALDVDAANVVVSALDAHAGDKDVLGACATCLGRLAVDARHASRIADAGGARRAAGGRPVPGLRCVCTCSRRHVRPPKSFAPAAAAADVAGAITEEALRPAPAFCKLCGNGLDEVIKAKRDVPAALLKTRRVDPRAARGRRRGEGPDGTIDADGREASYLARRVPDILRLPTEDDAAAARDVARLPARPSRAAWRSSSSA